MTREPRSSGRRPTATPVTRSLRPARHALLLCLLSLTACDREVVLPDVTSIPVTPGNIGYRSGRADFDQYMEKGDLHFVGVWGFSTPVYPGLDPGCSEALVGAYGSSVIDGTDDSGGGFNEQAEDYALAFNEAALQHLRDAKPDTWRRLTSHCSEPEAPPPDRDGPGPAAGDFGSDTR